MTSSLAYTVQMIQEEHDKAMRETDLNAARGHLEMVKVFSRMAIRMTDRWLEVMPNDTKE